MLKCFCLWPLTPGHISYWSALFHFHDRIENIHYFQGLQNVFTRSSPFALNNFTYTQRTYTNAWISIWFKCSFDVVRVVAKCKVTEREKYYAQGIKLRRLLNNSGILLQFVLLCICKWPQTELKISLAKLKTNKVQKNSGSVTMLPSLSGNCEAWANSPSSRVWSWCRIKLQKKKKKIWIIQTPFPCAGLESDLGLCVCLKPQIIRFLITGLDWIWLQLRLSWNLQIWTKVLTSCLDILSFQRPVSQN